MTTPSTLPSQPTPIGGYEDWPAHAHGAATWTADDPETDAVARLLGIPALTATDVRTGPSLVVDGVEAQPLDWTVGYGPRTRGWLLRPQGTAEPLPGVLALHCHGGARSVGGEQLVDLGERTRPRARAMQQSAYDGLAPASALARRGYAVLAHDAFSWDSRRFDLSRPTVKLAGLIDALEARWARDGVRPSDDERFDAVSNWHEETVAKTAGILGQTFAGLVLADDLAALDLVAGLPGVDRDRLGCFGFSGGGGRALLLGALDHRVRAAVVSCMMATFASTVPDRIDQHSWLLHAPGLAVHTEWPDLTRLGRARFLVSYRSDDALFTPAGMRAADDRLTVLHRGTDRYTGAFHPGPHGFGATEQAEAWAFLDDALRPAAPAPVHRPPTRRAR
ncbi:dienelactone hydrolase [Friedmanniella endophytica]|uniref:Dienelactone hydrolase n=1 Tax=Microlunatus kandeliicorticis TaxID=1759536 RepID=A0A7W3IRX3_9ACTN|nr:acetylxylan esterase [Microlunatus kandeliicorticis]MBA8794139.1 dienelactone hydrolase [Microlunatus kandeliicorticis]